MDIDHLVWAHPDLDAAVAEIDTRIGVLAAGGGAHPGQGTHNSLLALGDASYLEILAPDPSQPEASRPDVPGAGGLVAWALACDDIEATVEGLRSKGYDPGGIVDRQRRDPSGADLRWRVAYHDNNDDLLPFLIDWGGTPHPSLAAPKGLSLKSLHVEHPRPEAISVALAALGCDVEVRRASGPALVALLDGPNGEHQLR